MQSKALLFFKPVLESLFAVSNAYTGHHMTGSDERPANHPDMMWN